MTDDKKKKDGKKVKVGAGGYIKSDFVHKPKDPPKIGTHRKKKEK